MNQRIDELQRQREELAREIRLRDTEDAICHICNNHDDIADGPVRWVRCDDCFLWFHLVCLRLADDPPKQKWRCEPCVESRKVLNSDSSD